TDVGVLVNGFPREAALAADIGGVRTNFRMPDVRSIGLGGGSYVDGSSVGPQSVGYRLTEEALIFGGNVLTATDIAVAAGGLQIGEPALVSALTPDLVAEAMDAIGAMIDEA